MTRRRPIVVVTTALLVVLAACNNGGPATTAAREPAGKPLHYVALGGDDAYGARQRLDGSWPQLLFREHLPADATLVNLASPRHGTAEIRDDELPVALRLRPDIVTITALDDLERDTNPAEVQSQLSAIIRSAQGRPRPRRDGADRHRTAFGGLSVQCGRDHGSTGEWRGARRARLGERHEPTAARRADRFSVRARPRRNSALSLVQTRTGAKLRLHLDEQPDPRSHVSITTTFKSRYRARRSSGKATLISTCCGATTDARCRSA